MFSVIRIYKTNVPFGMRLLLACDVLSDILSRCLVTVIIRTLSYLILLVVIVQKLFLKERENLLYHAKI